jgi:putative ABC transport system substrate-binding protein
MPIVFITGIDPVKDGLVPNLNRPGGNITGTTALQTQFEPKRLGLLHELLPRATTIAVLANPTRMESEVPALQEAARAIGKEIKVLHASTADEIDAAFARLSEIRADALFVAVDPFFFTQRQQIVTAAARRAVPAMYYRREFASAGRFDELRN